MDTIEYARRVGNSHFNAASEHANNQYLIGYRNGEEYGLTRASKYLDRGLGIGIGIGYVLGAVTSYALLGWLTP